MKFRKFSIGKNKKIILGKDKYSNDELMKKFKGKSNKILHTASPGSPFCVVDFPKPTKKDLQLSGSVCLGYSQDWRDNQSDAKVDIFMGKDIYKSKFMPIGTWGIRKKKSILIKKKDVLKAKEKLK